MKTYSTLKTYFRNGKKIHTLNICNTRKEFCIFILTSSLCTSAKILPRLYFMLATEKDDIMLLTFKRSQKCFLDDKI